MDSYTSQQATQEQPQPSESYEACEQCNAPVDSAQRYCVVCGSRRKHVDDPAARFLSAATGRGRPSPSAASGSGGRRSRSPSLAAALAVAVIPLAVALGVLIGRGGNNQDGKLLAALRAQKPEVVNVGGGGGGAAASTTAASTPAATTTQPVALHSTFSLQSGYTIELGTLPGHGTDQAAVGAAERADRAKGAPAVGLITPSADKLTPAPPAGAYVIYSGQYKTQAAAEQALAKLKKSFPHAIVVSVGPIASSSSGGGGSSGPVLNATNYGSFHAVGGNQAPSKAQLNQGEQAAKHVASEINKNYVQSQKGLPNQISVP